jgi:hypothetical protein
LKGQQFLKPYPTHCTRWKLEIAKVEGNSKPEIVTAAAKALAMQENLVSGKWVIVQKVGEGGK